MSQAPIKLTIDGRAVEVPGGTSIWDAARRAGIEIPVLCHHPKLRPVGVCRVCAVEIEGQQRLLAASCVRTAEEGMAVRTDTPRIHAARRALAELLLADYPAASVREQKGDRDLLLELARAEGAQHGHFQAHANGRPQDNSSPVIFVDHAACILCDRCIRACDEIQVNQVIGRNGKGSRARIGFDQDVPMGKSTCVACGECAAYCPTGALTDKVLVPGILDFKATRVVPSVCPYCGVGCSIDVHVKQDKVVRITGRLEGQNQGRLCVKGRYGFDYTLHPDRLTVPLIRKPDRPKRPEGYPNPREQFREAGWDEALELCASTFARIKRETGPGSLAGFGSAKCSNEDNYLFQKLIRAVFGTNNVDHCTRLCHASSVAALMETIGSGAVSNVYADIEHADAALIIGSNTNENHPVAASFFKQAALRGTQIIVADPRRPDISDQAILYLRHNPGTDVALLNGIMHVILREGWQRPDFIAQRTEGFERLREVVAAYTPEVASRIAGVPPEKIEEAARIYGTAKAAMIFWGMGISQHTTGTDNARCLISLCLMTGNIGRRGTGLHPLRGQNNVQGASDVGLIPFVYSGYQSVEDPKVREKFERAWGVALDSKAGLTVVEIMSQVKEQKIRAMFMMGENPFLSDPNINKVKVALATMEFLCVQDIFMTETAEYADVILPATTFFEKEGSYVNTDRRVQHARAAVAPPGSAREDWKVLIEMARRMGYPMEYQSPAEIWEEIRQLTPFFAGISYPRMEGPGVLWPAPSETEPSTEILFTKDFPTGRGKFVAVEFAPAKELPDDQYPFVLNTGRVLQHWHTGTMTRRAKVLDEISPGPFVEFNPADLERLGLQDQMLVKVRSRRGEITLPARSSRKVSPGSLFIPFHFKEAAANLLTIDALDPYGKIPEFKFCAVQVERA